MVFCKICFYIGMLPRHKARASGSAVNLFVHVEQTSIKKNKEIEYGYKFIDGNIGISDDGIITLPLYMAAFI